jgi:phenylalanyl-tRNA synthetase beta chain
VRVPIGWLAEHVDVPAGTTVEDLDAAFVRLGLEVEEVHRPAEVTGPLVVGRVLEIEELTGFKKPIRYCRVDVGETEPRGIVCGATNFAVGDAVVVALPGAVLPGGFEIAARTTYDHVSDGMICSVRELGVGEDHAGILVLGDSGDDGAPAPGTPAGPVVGLDDVVVELAITPDRGYCLAMRGIAREMGTGLGVPWRDPGALSPPAWSGEPAWQVTVADADRCDRFSMVALEGLDPTAPSPWWMRRRLAQSGVRSISLAVDVTNYVMLELGQPMHAFDRDRVQGAIVVRRAREGERLTTLDGADRRLASDDLLITDDSGPIGLAAVMGGASTEIGDGTANVLLEAAHWEPTGVARTARRHRLPSEAAKRFERGVDPEMTVVALARAAALLAEYGGARVVGSLVDVDTRGPRPTIVLDAERPGRIAGVPYPSAQVTELLAAVGCTVDGDGPLTVTPPSWRPDLTDPADLVEEVVRLAGYDDVPSVLPTAPPGRGLTERQRRRRAVGRALAEFGYVEAPSFPFVGTAALDALGLAEDDPRRQVVLVRNPLSEEEPALRTTLLAGLLAALARNLSRGIRDVALFEHGAVFPGGERSPAPLPGVDRRPDDETLAALLGAVPEQPWHVAVALAGDREPRGWWGPGRPAVWADAVQAARRVAEAASVELTVRAGERAPWHPGRCAELLVDGRVVGHAGELHPRVCAALDLPARTSGMELDVDALPPARVPVGPRISTFPPVFVDLAFVLDEQVPAAAVAGSIREAAGDLLEAVRLFDVYTGPQVGKGRKSLAYALTMRAPDRTLSTAEAAEVRQRVVTFVEQAHQAELRG